MRNIGFRSEEQPAKTTAELLSELHQEDQLLGQLRYSLLEEVHKIEHIEKQIKFLEHTFSSIETLSTKIAELLQTIHAQTAQNKSKWNTDTLLDLLSHAKEKSESVLGTLSHIQPKIAQLLLNDVHTLYVEQEKHRPYLQSVDERSRVLHAKISGLVQEMNAKRNSVLELIPTVQRMKFERTQNA